MPMVDVSRIKALTAQVLDDFESHERVSQVVRRAHRIAVLRHDYPAQAWFMLQQRDMKSATDPADLLAIRDKIVSLLGDEIGTAEYAKQVKNYEASREMLGAAPGSTYVVSVDQIETVLSQLEESTVDRPVPTNLTPIDAGMMVLRRDEARTKLWPQIVGLRNILSRIRQSTHDYLVVAEEELDAGQQESGFIDRVYVRINTLLSTYAPDAAAKFVAAQDRLLLDDPEAVSHALTSCRRMIKSLADALFPATDAVETGIDGVARKMSDDAYKNRLLQYVQERVGKHKSGAVLQAVIADLDKRLKALDALSSKGVHAETSISEAQTCVLQTYLLAGDLLSIAEGSAMVLDGGAAK